MKEDEKETWTDLEPAALSPGLQARFLAAMQQAAAEENRCAQVEQVLGRFAPAPLSAARQGIWEGVLYRESSQALLFRQRRGRWYRRWAVAASLLLLAGAACMLVGEADSSLQGQGLASRSVIDTQGGAAVQWENEHTPVWLYDVVYEDSLVLESTGSTTIVVRVPSRESVRVPAEMI